MADFLDIDAVTTNVSDRKSTLQSQNDFFMDAAATAKSNGQAKTDLVNQAAVINNNQTLALAKSNQALANEILGIEQSVEGPMVSYFETLTKLQTEEAELTSGITEINRQLESGNLSWSEKKKLRKQREEMNERAQQVDENSAIILKDMQHLDTSVQQMIQSTTRRRKTEYQTQIDLDAIERAQSIQTKLTNLQGIEEANVKIAQNVARIQTLTPSEIMGAKSKADDLKSETLQFINFMSKSGATAGGWDGSNAKDLQLWFTAQSEQVQRDIMNMSNQFARARENGNELTFAEVQDLIGVQGTAETLLAFSEYTGDVATSEVLQQGRQNLVGRKIEQLTAQWRTENADRPDLELPADKIQAQALQIVAGASVSEVMSSYNEGAQALAQGVINGKGSELFNQIDYSAPAYQAITKNNPALAQLLQSEEFRNAGVEAPNKIGNALMAGAKNQFDYIVNSGVASKSEALEVLSSQMAVAGEMAVRDSGMIEAELLDVTKRYGQGAPAYGVLVQIPTRLQSSKKEAVLDMTNPQDLGKMIALMERWEKPSRPLNANPYAMYGKLSDLRQYNPYNNQGN